LGMADRMQFSSDFPIMAGASNEGAQQSVKKEDDKTSSTHLAIYV